MEEEKCQKRKSYISWDEYFMSIAKLSAMRSKDPSTQVGACIVSDDNRILSIGYNGAPNGFNDDSFPWGREGENLNTKYPYVCHAELNALLNMDEKGAEDSLEEQEADAPLSGKADARTSIMEKLAQFKEQSSQMGIGNNKNREKAASL